MDLHLLLYCPQGYEDKMPPVSPRVWSHWGRGHLLQRERQTQGLCPPSTTVDGFPQYVVSYPQQTGILLKILVYSNAPYPPPQLSHSLKSTTPEQSLQQDTEIFSKFQPERCVAVTQALLGGKAMFNKVNYISSTP